MTTNDRATRLLQTWLESEAPPSAPTDLLDRIDTATRSERPRPAWIARLEGHHVDVIEGGRRSAAPRLSLVLAAIGLLLATVVAAALVAGTFHLAPIVGPVPTSSAGASAPVASTPATVASQSPRPTAVPRIPEPGSAIPDELIGVWYVTPGEYLHIQRGPDPYCQAKYRILQDCSVWWDDSQHGIQGYADILTIVDGKLRDMPTGRADCAGSVSTMTWTRTGDSLQLQFQPGSCYTRNFPTMYLVGSGQGGAPASVPPLTFP